MILLFNTGYRIGYVDNIFKTLFYPKGYINEYRYTIAADKQVDDSLVSMLKDSKGQQVLVCFGDRFGGIGNSSAYVFYPLRTGRIHGVHSSGDRVFVKVELEDYVSSESPIDFTNRLYGLAKQYNFDLLRYKENPENDKDGRYVFKIKDEDLKVKYENHVNDADHFVSANEKSWDSTVTRLAELAVFKEKINAKPVFAKAEFFSMGRRLLYSTVSDVQMFEIEKDDDLRIVVDYYFPAQESDMHALAEMKIIAPQGAQVVTDSTIPLGMKKNRIETSVFFEPNSEKKYFTFDFIFNSKIQNEKLIAVTGSLLLKARVAGWRQLVLILSIIFYVSGTAVLASKDYLAWGVALQSVSLLAMLRVLGKKVV